MPDPPTTAAGYYVVRYPHTTVDVNVCFRCGRHTADTTAHDEWHDGTTLP